jgi:hypothetical protein
VCAIYAGSFENNPGGIATCTLCAATNPLGDCTHCPSGFVPESFPVQPALCNGGGAAATLTFCSTPPPSTLPPVVTPPDYMGAYLQRDGCASGCETPNPYTSECKCPDGTVTAQSFPLKIETSACGGGLTATDGTLVICDGPGKPVTYFGSYYQDSKGVCLDGSGCKCPTGSVPSSYAVRPVGATTTTINYVVICTPG